MSPRNWLRSWLSPRPAAPAPRTTLGVQALEAREVPAAALASAFALGESGEWAKDIAADAAGNTYVVGMFNSTVDFDPTHTNPAAVLTSHTFVDANGITRPTQDGFVAKYDPTGACVWAVALGSGTPAGDQVEGVAVHPGTGAVYVTGQFPGTADFGPFQRTAQGGHDGYVARLDAATGAVGWVHQFGGAYDFDIGYGVAVDPVSGAAYATGRVNLTAGNSNNNMDVYVARFDPAAIVYPAGAVTPTWVKQTGGQYGDEGTSVAVDLAGNVVVAGNFADTADLDPGPGTYTLRSGSRGQNPSAFALKLTAGGAFSWATNFAVAASGSMSRADDVATDSQGNVYLTGGFSGTVDFDPGKGKLDLPRFGGIDIYAAKLTPMGTLAWAKSMGGNDNDNYMSGGAIAVDAHDNVYLTGHFNTGTANYTAQFGGTTLQSFGDQDVFVAKLSGSTGMVQWAYAMGGAGSDRGEGIAVDGSGNVYLTGFFNDPADFDPDPAGTFYLDDGTPGYAAFVVKLTQDNW